MSMRFANKVALVSGGNSGIGRGAAQAFADEASFITGVDLFVAGVVIEL